jgi:hypothetical protein
MTYISFNFKFDLYRIMNEIDLNFYKYSNIYVSVKEYEEIS